MPSAGKALQKALWLSTFDQQYFGVCCSCGVVVDVFNFACVFKDPPQRSIHTLDNTVIVCAACHRGILDRGVASFVPRMRGQTHAAARPPPREYPEGKRVSFNRNTRGDVWDRSAHGRVFLGRCWLCHSTVTPFGFHIAHIRALNKNGSNQLSNLVVMCPTCNTSSGVHDAETYRKDHGFAGTAPSPTRETAWSCAIL